MVSINPIYNGNNITTLAFKAKETNESALTSNPISQSNINLSGTEALAAYNYNLVNKNDFDISLVEPIKVPDDINEVKGERIYNSNGELMEIVDEDNNFKKIYRLGDIPQEKYKLIIVDKKSNKVIKRQSEFKYAKHENSSIDVVEFKDNMEVCTSYDSKTLTPIEYSKIVNTGENEKHISYDFECRKFGIDSFDKNTGIRRYSKFDDKGHLLEKPIVENKKEEYINIEKPSLHPKFELNYDPKELDGEKKYYSNGVIEQNIVNNNGQKIVYKFNTKGEVEEIQKDNLTIYYFDDETYYPCCSIKEDFGDGKSKTSCYYADGATSCSIDDNGYGKQYDFNKTGNIIRYYDYTYKEI